MKKLIAIASIAVLAACAKPAEETPAPAETTAAAAPEAVAPGPGIYQVKYADGSMGEVTLNADNTYTAKDGKGVETTGTFAMKDGKSCFDAAGDVPEMCWKESPANADGTFSSTSDDGTVVTVTPPAATAAPTPMASAAPEPAAQ